MLVELSKGSIAPLWLEGTNFDVWLASFGNISNDPTCNAAKCQTKVLVSKGVNNPV